MSRKPRKIYELKRRTPQLDSYDRVLIVCEGGKTEPNYFKALINDYKLNTANVVVDGNSDSSPRSVVAYAKNLFKEDQKRNGPYQTFDKVYCVFDRDEHPTYVEALNTIESAQPPNVFHAITSNPCFEFWLLLHFIFTTRPIAREGEQSPGDVTLRLIEEYLPNYIKGDKLIYHRTKSLIEIAIKNAKRVKTAAEITETDNPHTLVYQLVEYLRALNK